MGVAELVAHLLGLLEDLNNFGKLLKRRLLVDGEAKPLCHDFDAFLSQLAVVIGGVLFHDEDDGKVFWLLVGVERCHFLLWFD